MNLKEKNTDYFVYELLKEAGISLEAQSSSVKEINEALKTASKSKNNNNGAPEFIGVVKDFVLVIEDKRDLSNHIKFNDKNLVDESIEATKNYAVNGAIHYAKHIAQNTSYKKIIAFGISGNEKKHKITPIFVNERCIHSILKDVETFISFNDKNINDYYTREILKEPTKRDKTIEELTKDAKKLHEDLRNYGAIEDKNKPLIVAGILLALEEIKFKNFDISSLNADEFETDGIKIYKAIESNLKRAKVAPEVKRDKLLSQFSVIKDTKKINEINQTLNKTPLKFYTEFLYENIYKNIKFTDSTKDYLGEFYREFMSYGGGDGQTLGIILTPYHITELFCELIDIKPNDYVFDPTCGTGGFLISAMHYMIKDAKSERQIKDIKEKQLFGLELQSYMFTIATANMILRGDGKSNLINDDFLAQNPFQIQTDYSPNVGMMNPPYSQGSKANPNLYEIAFTEHLLNSLVKGGRCIVIIPQSSVTGKSKEEKNIKENILKHHTLEGVITLNKDTFYGVGTNPCIAIFTAYEPHPKDKECKFINFKDDGYEVIKHIGLVETSAAKDKRQHLLDVWFDRVSSETKFCVKTTIEADDEWLHSFYYFNDEIPTYEDFEKTMADYLTFEFNMITHGRGYLFGVDDE